MLTLLAAKIKSVPALVLASYRDDEVHRSQQLRVVLGELAPGPGRIKLQPLSSDAVAELAGPAGLDPAELYRQTSGNPFFITEVLATGGVDIPDSVRDAVLAWAPRLSDAGRSCSPPSPKSRDASSCRCSRRSPATV